MHPSRTLALAALFASFLSACGGGGGGDAPTATDNQNAPLASGTGGAKSPAPAPAPTSSGTPVAAGGTSSEATAGPGASAPAPAPGPAPAPAPAAAFSAFDPVLLASNPLPSGAAVARLAGGGNVALWVASGATTRDSRLMAQRTDASGHPVGAAITVHEEVERVASVSVAAAPDGGFLVAWAGFDTVAVTPASAVLNLMARRYAADGTLLSETRLTPESLYAVQGVAVEPAPGGGFVVGWSSQVVRTAPYWGYVQRLGAGGELAGPQVKLVEDNTGLWQEQVGVVPLADGTVTAVWRQRSATSPFTYAVYTRQLDASMQPMSAPIELIGTRQGTPLLVSAAASGPNLALAWTMPGTGDSDIHSSIVAPGSAVLGNGAIRTSMFPVIDLRVEATGGGSFGVIWQELEGYPRGTNGYVELQQHDATGTPTGAPTELMARGISWVSDITGAGVNAGTVLAVDAGPDGHVVGEVQIAGKTEPAAYLFGR